MSILHPSFPVSAQEVLASPNPLTRPTRLHFLYSEPYAQLAADLLLHEVDALGFDYRCSRMSDQAAHTPLRAPSCDLLVCGLEAFHADGSPRFLGGAPALERVICLATRRSPLTLQLRRQGVSVLLLPCGAHDLLAEAEFVMSRPAPPRRPAPPESDPDQIVLSSADRYVMVAPRDIIAVESSGNYTTLQLVGRRPITISKQIGKLGAELAERQFYRVHNSHLVNRAHIKAVLRSGHLTVVLSTGKEVPVSRRRQAGFLAWLGLSRPS